MTRIVLSLLVLGLAASCGVKGGLERPGPMWNSRDAIARECARQRAEGQTPDARCAQQSSETPQPRP